MNQIQRIHRFLEEHKTKVPSLRNLIESAGIVDYYKIKLGKEYLKLSKHPHPKEYLEGS